MARKPKQPTPTSWSIYKVAKKAIWLGTVEATDKQAAIEKGAQEFKTEAWRACMRWRSDDTARRTEQQAEASMKIGPFDVKTVDECLDVLEDCFQSPMWRELSQEEKTRLIGRLSYILEITEKQELEK